MRLDPLGNLKRTHTCGELRVADAGKAVLLMGWVHRRRDLGHLIFLDLRDRDGLTQVVCNKEKNPEAHARADECRGEFVVAVEGTVAKREKANPNLSTGEVEVVASRVYLLNDARTPAFQIEDEVSAAEETRLRYRYLDLRRPKMQENLRLRHRVALAIRRALDEQGFYEIETPFLTRSTPEGARDYLVPSRVHPGHFYALPQSPQLFKQLLMISGFDRYFQIVRCFRDEDLRADRQPEFTQLDLEMAYATPDRVFAVIEKVMQAAWTDAGQKAAPPFPRLSHAEALARYGSDKPDTRFGMELIDVSGAFESARETLKIELPVHAIVAPGAASFSRKQLDALGEFVKQQGGRALYHAKVTEQGIDSGLKKALGDAGLDNLRQLTAAKAGDLILAVPSDVPAAAGKPHAATSTVVGALRLHLARELKLIPEGKWNFLWITEFPLFEWSAAENRWVSSHHPFTSPAEADLDKLEKEPGTVRSQAYDLVLNGWELGSGSIRIHRQDIQQRIFRVLGLSDEEAKERFGFFLEALSYGTPPHGGIALGLDRIAALLCGESSLREVIAFPKTTAAQDLMADAPSQVDAPSVEELELWAAYPDLHEIDWALAHLADELLKFVEDHIFAREDLAFDSTYRSMAALFLAAAHANARAAVRVAKSGYGQQAAVLARSIFEGLLNLAWISADPDTRAVSFHATLKESLKRRAKKMKEEGWPEVDELTRQQLEGLLAEPSAEPRKSLRQKAGEVGLGSAYDSLYAPLSELAHFELGGLVSYTLGEKLEWIRVGPGPQWVTASLGAVLTFFYDLLQVFFKCFPETKSDEPARIQEKFWAITKAKKQV